MARLDNQLQNSGYVVSRLLTHVVLMMFGFVFMTANRIRRDKKLGVTFLSIGCRYLFVGVHIFVLPEKENDRLTYEERKELQEASFIFRRETLKENTLYNDSYRK